MECVDEKKGELIKAVSMMSTAPVPLQYPADLIIAQRMYALSMAQLLKVEQQISQLQFQLYERERRSASSAAAAAVLSAVSMQGKETGLAQIRVEVDPRQLGGGVQAQAGGQEAARDGAQQPQGEHFRQQRQRLSNAVKIAFVMLLLEFSTGWFFVYFFCVFLYIGGVFDPIISWFQRRPTRVALEQQLNGLRNRQRRDEERSADQADTERTTIVEQSPTALDDSKAETEDPVSSEEAAKGSSSSVERSVTEGLQDGMEETAPPQAPAGENVENVDQPPYWHRFIYQLFVMFFLTLLPWWSPDPRYAETQNI